MSTLLLILFVIVVTVLPRLCCVGRLTCVVFSQARRPEATCALGGTIVVRFRRSGQTMEFCSAEFSSVSASSGVAEETTDF